MAVRRRPSARSGRWQPSSQSGAPRDGETKVSFIGEEIDQAIRRIREQGGNLPLAGRLAVRVASATLRLCKLRIKAAIDCDAWGIKG